MKFCSEKINNIYPRIKFTVDWSNSWVNFLNVKLIMKDGKIITDLHLKATDTYLYLDSLSCLPYHCKKSTPYSQALRLNRFCSNNAFFYQTCNELEYWLHERGYSESFDFSCFGLLLSLFTSSSFLLLLSLLLSLFNYFHYYILLSL